MLKIPKIAMCKFKGNDRTYAYYTSIEDLQPGDRVVAQAKDDYSVVEFVEYNKEEKQWNFACKWLVQKLDLSIIEKNKLEYGL